MNVAELFDGMSERLQADKAAGVTMSVGFDLGGDEGGQWLVKIADGKLDVDKGSVDGADATIKMSAEDFKAMSTGGLNPMMAFMTGKVKVDGDLNTVMKFQSLVGF